MAVKIIIDIICIVYFLISVFCGLDSAFMLKSNRNKYNYMRIYADINK